MPRWKPKSRVYLRRIQGEHGGWPLFPMAISTSARRESLFRVEDDRRLDRRRLICAAPARRCCARGGAATRQRVHPHHAGAVRLRAVARGAGDAGRDHAAAEMVSVSSRQDLVLEPHRHRAAVGADGEEAGARNPKGRAHRRAVSRTAGDARPDAEGAAAESVVVLVFPWRRQCAARGRAVFSERRGSARSRAPSPGSSERLNGEDGLGAISRRWPTA